MEKEPVDLVMRYEKYHTAAKEVANKGFRKYLQTNDFKLLKELSPELASLLLKPNIELFFGAAPLVQFGNIWGTAWGEIGRYSSYNNAKIALRKVKVPFQTGLTLFWFNPFRRPNEPGACSSETLKAALKIYGNHVDVLPIVEVDEQDRTQTFHNVREVMKKSAEEALCSEVGGWSGMYSSIDSCIYESFGPLSKKHYLGVNPVFTKIKTRKRKNALLLEGKQETNLLLGYVVTRDTVYFVPEPLGKLEAKMEKSNAEITKRLNKSRRKSIMRGILIATAIIATIFLFLFGPSLLSTYMRWWRNHSLSENNIYSITEFSKTYNDSPPLSYEDRIISFCVDDTKREVDAK